MKIVNSYEKARGLFEKFGYPFYTKGVYNLNIFAIRNAIQKPNLYNDVLYIAYKEEGGQEVIRMGNCTTIPGVPFLVKPINPGGAAAIAEGHYPRLWKPGYSRGTWALLQVAPVRVYRDNDFNKIFNFKKESIHTIGVEGGFFLHESFMGAEPSFVDKSSAGCIVPQSKVFLLEIKRLVNLQYKYIKTDVVSFTLFNSAQTDGYL